MLVREPVRLAGRSGLPHGGHSCARPSRAPSGKPLYGGTMGGLGPTIQIVNRPVLKPFKGQGARSLHDAKQAPAACWRHGTALMLALMRA